MNYIKRLLIVVFCLLAFSSYSQDDPGLSLYWQEFVDSNDLVIVYDSVQGDSGYTYFPVDTTFRIKYMAFDTQSVTNQGILIYQRIRTKEQQVYELQDQIMDYADIVAINQRNAMRARAKMLSAKKYYEDFTGDANAYLVVYNDLWPNLPELTIRSTNTDTESPYYFPVTTAQPNAAGVIRDENNVIIARIFPLSKKYLTVTIANNGNLVNGESVTLYSEDSRTFIAYDSNDNVGRIVISMSRQF